MLETAGWCMEKKAPCLLSSGARQRLARGAGKPLLLEEFGAPRDYMSTRASLISECPPPSLPASRAHARAW